MENTAKLFICNNPSQLFLFKNLSRIIKKYNPGARVILFKVNHPYFLKLNFEPYKQYFDEIIDFKFIHYKKNFLLSYWEIFNFQNKFKKIKDDLLLKFDKIDLFLPDSTWLPVNVLLYNLARQENIKNITMFTVGQLECSQTKIDNLKTLLCNLYTLPFRHYKVKVMTTLGGKFLDFVYADQIPGTVVKIVNPTAQILNNLDWEKENILPFPIISENSPTSKQNMVIIFGEASVYQDLSEYLPEYKSFVKKLTAFFKAIENKYPDCKIYYKPHPSDGSEVMPGIDPEKYSLFDNAVNAQAILDAHHQKIKAVYTLSSTAVVSGAFFGIPSYTSYKYLFNRGGIEKMDSLFNQMNSDSEFLFHITDLSDIGKIDNLERPNLDSEKSDKIYRKILNV